MGNIDRIGFGSSEVQHEEIIWVWREREGRKRKGERETRDRQIAETRKKAHQYPERKIGYETYRQAGRQTARRTGDRQTDRSTNA